MKRISTLAVLGALFLSPLALAAETETETASEEDDEFDFLSEGDEAAAERAEKAINGDDFDAFELEDDDDFSAFGATKPPPVKVQKAAPVIRAALGDHFPVEIVQTLPNAVIVELPVVVGTRADVISDYWLVGEVFVDGEKVGESRQLVMASSLSDASVTTYLKLHAPVSAQQGQVEVQVSQIVDGKTNKLFGRKAAFRL
ncbi:MAG: hypothetical protein ACI9VR_005451 [Cognaticolwellia sp.]|jgi:hypothetical protein